LNCARVFNERSLYVSEDEQVQKETQE